MEYNKMLKINETFQYSINLQFDINNIRKIQEYIPTKDSCQVLENYVDSLLGDFSKATTLIGPYGKGKSHLLLILLTIFNDYKKEDEEILEKLFKKIKNINEELYNKIREIRKQKLKYMPVIINSNYNNMNQAFLLALTEAMERENINNIIADTYFSIALKVINKWEQKEHKEALDKFEACLKESNISLEELKNRLEIFDEDAYKIFKNVYSCVMHGMEFSPLINMDIIKYYKNINYKISTLGYNGMIIVFDEFSKFLECVENGSMMKDLKILQDFAELATRSGKSEQIILSCITHKAINEYLKNRKDDKINAFKTVEGRFKELYLNRSIEQNYDIISQTIEKRKEFFNEFEKLYIKNTKFYSEIESLAFAQIDNVRKVLFEGCFPLNPITVYGLIELCERIAQNERTLFTFLTDDDPYSLKSFIKDAKIGLFNIDRLYDYFSTSLKKTNEEQIKNVWIKSQTALNKVEDGLDIRIVKAIALIEMLNDFNVIYPNAKCISLALSEDEKTIYSSLKKLEENGVLKYKKLTQTYDFANVYNKEALNQISKLKESKFANINPRLTMEKVCDLGYVIPRRYNQDFKMTRYFKNIFLTSEELMNIKNTKILFEENECDGLIVNLLGNSNLQDIKEQVITLNDNRILIKIPKYDLNEETYNELKEFEAIQFLKNSSMLDEDISSELEIIKQEIIEYIQKDVDNKFNSSNIEKYLYIDQEYDNIKKFNSFISDICEEVYKNTVIINNEMINKNEISSPIYKARNIVIDTIVNNDKNLIKSETSAEATIYKAIVDKKDDTSVKNVIQILKNFIKKSENKQSFEKVLNKLYEKPYGVRKGIVPILIALAVQEYADNIILYYQTKEIDIEANNISKIIEMPDKYYISIEEGTEEKNKFINILLKEFNIEKKERQRENIKLIIDEMKRWILSLPRITREMSSTNKFISNETYILFKNEILKSDLNNNEFLFIKTKEIFQIENYQDIATKVIDLKNKFDNYLKWYSEDLIINVKEMFEYKSKTNLNNILKNWNNKISDKIKYKIMSIEIKKLFEFINDLNTYNDLEIIQNISYILLGFYIEDWDDNTYTTFYEKLTSIIEEIENLTNAKEESGEIVEINDGNTVIKKFINANEITQIGKTLQNNIEDTMEEYGSSISESEKIKILLHIMKKYI